MIAGPQSLTTSNPDIAVERRRALRALLRNPLLPATGETAKEYNLVRRHSVWLNHWLAKFPAWNLHIDKEVARLRKTPADADDETRPAIDATSGSPFSRRRYALLCLALAALERSERQTTLGKIAETIMDFESDHAQRASFHKTTIGAEIDGNMIHITRHQPSHQTPKFARQDVRLAVHRTNHIARFDRQTINNIRMDHDINSI